MANPIHCGFFPPFIPFFFSLMFPKCYWQCNGLALYYTEERLDWVYWQDKNTGENVIYFILWAVKNQCRLYTETSNSVLRTCFTHKKKYYSYFKWGLEMPSGLGYSWSWGGWRHKVLEGFPKLSAWLTCIKKSRTYQYYAVLKSLKCVLSLGSIWHEDKIRVNSKEVF